MRRTITAVVSLCAAAAVALGTAAVWGDAGPEQPSAVSTSLTTTSTVRPSTTTTTSSTTTTTTVATTTSAAAPVTTRRPAPAAAPATAAPAPPFAASVSTVTASDLHASWRAGCPVGPGDLRLLRVSHWGFDGAVHTGSLVVHAGLVDGLAAVFADLYADRFAIQRMEPIDAFGGSDDASMAANNTSAFNCRPVTGGTSWSEHSYGRAIDVNPVQNPYVRGSTVLPPAGRDHLDRSRPSQGKILAGDATVHAFGERGWRWGGYWSSSQDYQHFSTTGR